MHPFQITNHSHPLESIRNYIGEVFNLILHFFCKQVAPAPPLGIKPIELVYDKHGPIVYWPLHADKYIIGVNIEGKFPQQIIFQMAHELAHIFIDPRINGVFVEILCHKTAFDVLEDLQGPDTLDGANAAANYILNIQAESEKIKGFSLNQIGAETVFKTIRQLESINKLFDRAYNHLLALKIKEVVDYAGKYDLIRHTGHCVHPLPPSETDKLITQAHTIINIDSLLARIAKENSELGKALLKLKSD